MKISPLAFVAACAITLPASASSLGPKFQVVDLGTGYQLRSTADGWSTAVTGSGSSSSYAFDKSPTTAIDVRKTSAGIGSGPTTLGNWHYGGLHLVGYIQGTLQNGSLIQGYASDSVGYAMPRVPLGFSITNSWHNDNASPVSDMNASGAIVGTSSLYPSAMNRPETYAAFSDPAGKPHDRTSQAMYHVSDNLNNYIADDLSINLTQGLKIDDLGRIIAEGIVAGQTHDFLLIPAHLSAEPIPTPEPSTLALMATVAASCFVVRSARRAKHS